MTAEVTLHCDGPDCTTWAKAGALTEDWITVLPGTDLEPRHFCDGWCAMRWFATWAEPSTVIPMDGSGG
jgi:hypothetical protein